MKKDKMALTPEEFAEISAKAVTPPQSVPEKDEPSIYGPWEAFWWQAVEPLLRAFYSGPELLVQVEKLPLAERPAALDALVRQSNDELLRLIYNEVNPFIQEQLQDQMSSVIASLNVNIETLVRVKKAALAARRKTG